jgi:predicted metal-binding protein
MEENEGLSRFVDLAVQLGAVDAKVITADQIQVSKGARWKCRFGCPQYGKSLMCPPYTSTLEEIRSLLQEYRYALLFRVKPSTSPNLAVELERQIFLSGHPSAIAFSADTCKLCEFCDVDKGHCVKPSEARPTMEACGIDVFESVKKAGYDIEVLTSKDQEYFYYGLVLIK